MKAWELQATGWKLVDRQAPKLNNGEVLIRMKAASLNYRDLAMVRRAAGGTLSKPIIPLSDGAGQVIALGDGVRRTSVGARVMAAFFAQYWLDGERMPAKTAFALGGGTADGVMSQEIVLHEDALVAVPEGFSYEEAATLPCAAVTAWHALFVSGHVKPGDVVLLQGTGGVSVFGLQLAKLAGARVLITSSRDDKLEAARRLGADGLINYKMTPDWDRIALKMTAGRGVDIVLEVGGRETLAKSVRATQPGGVISLIGGLSGFDRDPKLRDEAISKGVAMHDIYVGSCRDFEDLNRALALHHVHPVVDRVFAFAQALDALKYLESGAHFGKVVIAI